MTKRSKTDSVRRGLSRVAGFVRASVEVARATDRLAMIGRQQTAVAARGLVPGTGRRAEVDSARAALVGRAGSQTYPGREAQSMSANAMRAIYGFASNVKALDAAVRVGESAVVNHAIDRMRPPSGADSSFARPTREHSDGDRPRPEINTTIDSRGRLSQMIRQSASGMEALRRFRNGGRLLVWAEIQTSPGRAPRVESQVMSRGARSHGVTLLVAQIARWVSSDDSPLEAENRHRGRARASIGVARRAISTEY